jgi:hypothetical protein
MKSLPARLLALPNSWGRNVMQSISSASSAAKTSLIYITIGALLFVWTGIWFLYLRNSAENVQPRTWYFCYGLLATGLVAFVIGLAVGQIGRQARHADLPPADVAHLAPVAAPNVTQPVVLAAAPGVAAQPAVVPAATAPVMVPAGSTHAVAPRI